VKKSLQKIDQEKISKQKIISFVDSIPCVIQDSISLAHILENAEIQLDENIYSTITFLKFFNVISTHKRGNDTLLTIPTIHAYHFLKSFSLYLKNNLPLISSWEDVIKSGDIFVDEFLNWGNQFLYAMERNRASNIKNTKPIAEVQIILMVIKANIIGSEEQQYLVRYNLKRLNLQLVGGYIEPEDLTENDAAYRLLCQELQFNEISKKDVEFKQFHPTIITNSTSVENGVYTSFVIRPFYVRFNKIDVKLDRLFQWVTLGEIKEGLTYSGMSLRFPSYEMTRNKQKDFYKILEKLPISMTKAQSSSPNKDLPSHTNIYKKDLPSISKLINEEESEHLEFKSSARWDYKNGLYNKELEIPIIKTIAAFLNTDGGVLLIGISDDKNILGIVNDVKTLNHKSEDSYSQFLTNMIKTYLGVEFCSLINIQYLNFDDRLICMLKVNKTVQPVFVKRRDDREFYVRAGNTSRMLNPEEAYKYIQSHW
jgi:hypothetical protein